TGAAMPRTLTPRENLLRTLRRQGFEWAPVESGGFCPAQVEAFEKRFGHRDYGAFFGNPSHGIWTPLKRTFDDPRALYPREELPERIHFDEFGIGHSEREGCWHMTHMHHPLQGDPSLDEVARYPLPVVDPADQEKMARQSAEIQSRGFSTGATLNCTVWETAWYLRSMEDLMADMMADDERATVLFDRVTALACDRARAYARAGVDTIGLGDDIGMQHTIMMSLDLWRKWLKPRLAAVIRAAREIKPDILMFYHSCGYVMPFIDELIEVGVDILNPVQPECMAFADVHKKFGGRISFWSTIGTQQTLPFGTPGEVREAVLANLRLCGAQGGIVIGPTHMVEPEVPWENLEAMRLAAKDYGQHG
ncbi:MAG: hypothetical protein FWF84_06520, partial [Kiritimatiellaeota bacterium]|nr:hypothetical protein [Kiritimatiellota bacterium]